MRIAVQILPVVLLGMLLNGCSTFDIANHFTQKSGSEVKRGVSYGNHPRQKLDIYTPSGERKGGSIIVFFYGGAWDSGKRSDYEFVGRKLSQLGHRVVIPDYRVYPQAIFPLFVEDGAAALAYVIENIDEISEKAVPIFVMGHSAGAHIAMSLGLNQQYLLGLGHSTDEIAGVIGLSGPYNFLPLTSDRLLKIFPDKQKQINAQPINFVDSNDPPVFLGHGDRDKRVWPGNSTSLALKLKQHDVPHKLLLYKGVDHSGTLKPFVSFLGNNSSIPGDVNAFIEKYSPILDKVDR